MKKSRRFKLCMRAVVLLAALLSVMVAAGPSLGLAPSDVGNASSDPDFWYYVGQDKVSLPVATDQLMVRFKPGLATSDKEAVVSASSKLAPLDKASNVPVPDLTLLEVEAPLSKTELLDMLDDLRADPNVAVAQPVFIVSDTRMTLTDQFVARFGADVTAEQIATLNEANDVELVKEIQLPNTYVLRIAQGSDVLAVANRYHESALTAFASPDFVRFLTRQFAPNDTHYPQQWGMENTGSNPPDGVGTVDADMDASSAWDIERGSSDVVIAIIDEGVELAQEDLNDKIVNHFSPIPGDGDGGDPNNSWDAHGTNCAGIAAAETNNAQGVAGVCNECSLMAVQIAYSIAPGGNWVTQDSWIADAITWSVDNGADILSNSWGGGSPSTVINSAIDYAVSTGRGGLGCPVLFAAGNGNATPVHYPARNNQVIAVGATSPCDERKNPSSCDGENWWGSNFGPSLDIVAPGVEWYATDMMGTAGYASGNYYDHMNGTSSATPAAAGLAGLLLSYKPCLTEAQVQEILETTAEDKVGLPTEDTAGWDQYMGWGRVNAHDALLAADDYPCDILGCRVLFDETHGWASDGQVGDYRIGAGFSELAALLESNGASVDALQDPAPFDYATISAYDTLVLMLPKEYYSIAEKDAIAAFVHEDGGRLVTIGENGGFAEVSGDSHAILNDVHAYLGDGIVHNDNYVWDPTDYEDMDYWVLIHEFAAKPVNDGVSTVLEIYGSSLDLSVPAYGTAFGDSDTYVAWTAASSPGATGAQAGAPAPARSAGSGAASALELSIVSPPADGAFEPTAPLDPQAVLWDQPVSTSDTTAYANQDFEAANDDFDMFIADDFTNANPWLIDTIFVPGQTWNSGCDLSCADALNWQIYGDLRGRPDGDPWGGGNAPQWSLSLSPFNSQVTLSTGLGGFQSNVTLNLDTPLYLPPGKWWLVAYPSLDFTSCGCQAGRHPADTTNGSAAHVINPGGGFGFGTGWTSVQDPAPWGLATQDFAFRLEGAVTSAEDVVVQAMADIGAGDVFAIGDANLWHDVDVDSDGQIDLYEHDNEQLALNVFTGICDEGLPPVIDPEEIDATLTCSETLQVPVTVTLGSQAVQKADVVFLFDRTGSMNDVADAVIADANTVMDQISAQVADAAFGAAYFADYNGTFAGCGYEATYGTGDDVPWAVASDVTTDKGAVATAMAGIPSMLGADYPECYSRVLWETLPAQDQIHWRDGAARIVVIFGDAPPHDCTFCASSTGPDPGRDEIVGTADDLVFTDVVDQLDAQDITVFSIQYDPLTCAPDSFEYMAVNTGGATYLASDLADVPKAIVDLIGAGVAEVDLSLVVDPSSFGWLVDIDPPVYYDAVPETSYVFDVTFHAPDGTPNGVYEFDLVALGDGSEQGRVHVTITLEGCGGATCVSHILFDETHGLAEDFTIHGRYSDLKAFLESQGHTVHSLQSPDPFDYATISAYDVLALLLPQEFYSSAEKDAIARFVNAGGRLVTIGEHGNYFGAKLDVLNDVHAYLGDGLHHNSDVIHDPTDYETNDFWPLIHEFKLHPVNTGVGTVLELAGSSFEISSPAYGTAFGDDDTYAAPSTAAAVEGGTDALGGSNPTSDGSEQITLLPPIPSSPAMPLAGQTYLTNEDNENNAHTGSPDGDMGGDPPPYICYHEAVAPIEFNIYVDGPMPEHNATLTLYAYDVDEEGDVSHAPEWDDVYFNGHFVGRLTGANDTWSTSVFPLDPGWVKFGNNLVEIEIDTHPDVDYWCVSIAWGQLLIDGGSTDMADIVSIDTDDCYEIGPSVSIDVDVGMDIFESGNYRLETNLINPDNITVDNEIYDFSASSGTVHRTTYFNLDDASTPGLYKVNANLFDADTGLQQDAEVRTFQYTASCGGVIVQAMADMGDGDVFAIGDANLWDNMDADGDSVTDLYEHDNEELALNVFGGICEEGLPPVIDPEEIDVTLTCSETLQVPVTVTLGSQAVQKADVVFLFDRTGSMNDVADAVIADANTVMNQISAQVADAAFGAAYFADYNGTFAGCGYEAVYGSGDDVPWAVASDVTTNKSAVAAAMAGIPSMGGADYPECYSRVLWETLPAQDQIHWRDGAARIVVIFGDAPPHDCTFCASSTGPDPGRDEIVGTADDLVFTDVVGQLDAQDITVFSIQYHPMTCAPESFEYMAVNTGGATYLASDIADVPQAIVDLIGAGVAEVDLSLVVDPSTYGWLVDIDPLVYYDALPETSYVFDVTFHAPDGTPNGVYEFDLVALGDGSEQGRVHVIITLEGCVCTGTTISIEPPSQNVGKGETFTADVQIADITDLGGFEFDLHYDPAVVHVLDVELGPFPGTAGRTWFEVGKNINNTLGVVSYGAGSYGATSGPNGTGVIAIVTLEAQNLEDVSILDLDAVQVTDSGGILIDPLCVADGSVTVTPCTPVSGADFSWSAPVRTGRPTTFNGTVGGGTPPITYGWDFGDTFGSSGQVVDHTYDHAMADTHDVMVRLDVSNACGADFAEHWIEVWLFFDFDMDCDVDIVDIMGSASRWNCASGDPCYDPFYDVEPDGDIDIVDIMQTAANWGWSCP